MNDKYLQLESLNRELRQVNLQQFIRQTGSKVTVLPPDADRGRDAEQAFLWKCGCAKFTLGPHIFLFSKDDV